MKKIISIIFLLSLNITFAGFYQDYDIQYLTTDFNDIAVDSESIYLCGTNGYVIKSDDFGKNFNKCNLKTIKEFISIEKFNGKLLVMTIDGYIYSSKNNG